LPASIGEIALILYIDIAYLGIDECHGVLFGVGVRNDQPGIQILGRVSDIRIGEFASILINEPGVPVDEKKLEEPAKTDAKMDKKAQKEADKAAKKAQKDADKAAKNAEKEAKKAAKQAEKDVKKAAKDAEKAAKDAAKKAE